MSNTRATIARWLSVGGTVVFLGVLGYYLGQPGYSWSRLVVFAVLGGLAGLGTTGVVYQRELLAAAGACGLLMLGFSLAASLWLYIVPAATILVVSALLIANSEPRKTPLPE
jgi:hypothetical protein